MGSCDQRVMWLYGFEHFTVSHNTVKFGGHSSCRSGD